MRDPQPCREAAAPSARTKLQTHTPGHDNCRRGRFSKGETAACMQIWVQPGCHQASTVTCRRSQQAATRDRVLASVWRPPPMQIDSSCVQRSPETRPVSRKKTGRTVRRERDCRMNEQRDRRIVQLVADPTSGTLAEVGKRFGLTASAVHKIGKRGGVVRGWREWPEVCSVQGCGRRHHALGWCEMHYRRAYRERKRVPDSVGRNSV